ncbi:MAG: amino acid--tRNA ligase-related protein [Spirochaetota bacterium]|nr:amino acid--tRNA ligase-related protein [Spirochaetota bacterium]
MAGSYHFCYTQLMDFEAARQRSFFIDRIRRFFIERGYLEVDTPLLSPALIPEAPIEIFETTLRSIRGSRPLYLIPSPEVHMKKLLAAGSGNIFQICRSFRNLEQTGRHHNPEFTMLEWYTVGADYRQSAAVTEELFADLAETAGRPELAPPFRKMSIREAFNEFAGIDLLETRSLPQLRSECRRLGMLTVKGAELQESESSDLAEPPSWEELYHRIFLTYVEPRLPMDKPLLLTDYPRQIPCLAKDIPGSPWKERWELYVDGIEVANCYSEETDPVKVERFFCDEYAKKSRSSMTVPDIDREFLQIFHRGYPESSGVALGVDRLIMSLTRRASIEGVIFFPISDTL